MESQPPFEALPLAGEHDCCLGLPLEPASIENDRALASLGLPLEAEAGLSGNDFFKFGGASREKPGISLGFQGLGFTVGELPRDDTGFFNVVGTDFGTEEDRLLGGAATVAAPEGVNIWRVGVAGLDVDFKADGKGLAVGVEERAEVLLGVEDLTGGPAGLVEGKVAREVGVDALEGLAVVGTVSRLVGVAGLVAAAGPPDEEGLLLLVFDEFSPECKVVRFDATLIFEAGSSWIFVSYIIKAI